MLTLLFFAAIFGIFLNYTDSDTVKTTKQCNIDLTQECKLFDSGHKISVQFMQEPEVEEELSLKIVLPNSTKISQMWVQGINMYMGKSAVLTNSIYMENNHKIYNAGIFLGACSEPVMRWQLIIKTIDDAEVEQSWFFNFSTDRNKKAE